VDKALAAARLSAALGERIRPEDIEHVEGSMVLLGPGKGYELYAGNACYAGNGRWFKNGRPWGRAGQERNVPRPLDLG
jgi:hypothetical protein